MTTYNITGNFAGLATAFEAAPDRVERFAREQLKIAVRDIKEYAHDHHAYTPRSGLLEREGIVTMVDGNKGVVALSPAVPYGIYVHEGTKPHTIAPREKKVLRFVGRGGIAFASRVKHPGIEKDPFLYDAAEAQLPHVQMRFAVGLERILEGL